MQFRRASLCLGRSVTFRVHRSAGICPLRWVHLTRQYIACPILVAAADGEQRVQGPLLPRAPDVGVIRLALPGVRVRARAVRVGGV